MNALTRRARVAALLTLGLGLAACSGVEQLRDPDFEFDQVTTYAWKEAPTFAADVSGGDGELEVLRDLERRVERRLEDRGIDLVPKDRAQLLLSGTVAMVTRAERNDRNFAQYETQLAEYSITTLRVFDRQNRKLVWVGEREQRLRVKSVAFGGMVTRYQETGEPRDWQTYQVVDDILAAMPR